MIFCLDMGSETELQAVDVISKYATSDKDEDKHLLSSEIKQLSELLSKELQNTQKKYEIIETWA